MMKKKLHIMLLPFVLLLILGVVFGIVSNRQRVKELEQQKEDQIVEQQKESMDSAASTKNIPVDRKINQFEMDLSTGKVTILSSDTSDITIDCGAYDSFYQWKIEQGSFILETTDAAELKENRSIVPEIKCYIPKDMLFDTVELDVETGTVVFESPIECNHMDIELETGNIEFSGTIHQSGKWEVDKGDLSINLTGYGEEEYNYRTEIDLGHLEINGSNYAHLNKDKEIDNGAPRTLEIKCDKGAVKLNITK